jgi:hypothetical protein
MARRPCKCSRHCIVSSAATCSRMTWRGATGFEADITERHARYRELARRDHDYQSAAFAEHARRHGNARELVALVAGMPHLHLQPSLDHCSMAACVLLLAGMPAGAAASAVVELTCVVHHHLYRPAHVRSKLYLPVRLTHVQAFRPRETLKSCVVQQPERHACNEGQPGRCGVDTCAAENRGSGKTEQPHLLSVMSARYCNGECHQEETQEASAMASITSGWPVTAQCRGCTASIQLRWAHSFVVALMPRCSVLEVPVQHPPNEESTTPVEALCDCIVWHSSVVGPRCIVAISNFRRQK